MSEKKSKEVKLSHIFFKRRPGLYRYKFSILICMEISSSNRGKERFILYCIYGYKKKNYRCFCHLFYSDFLLLTFKHLKAVQIWKDNFAYWYSCQMHIDFLSYKDKNLWKECVSSRLKENKTDCFFRNLVLRVW